MILKFIYQDYNNNTKLGELEVEEKPKTFKIIKCIKGGYYGSLINKNDLNKIYDRSLFYNCSDEESIKIWNEYMDKEIEKLKEKIKKLELGKL